MKNNIKFLILIFIFYTNLLPFSVSNSKKICIIGTGYVGLVLGACLSDFGHIVTCVDKDKEKIKELQNGKIPIYELGLTEIIYKNVHKNTLKFSDEIEKEIKNAEVIYIAVGTPTNPDGETFLDDIISASILISKNLNEYKLICIKSTVPIGTNKFIKEIIQNNQTKKVNFDVVSNPEFLREGVAVNDFLNPRRIIFGIESEKAKKILSQIYEPFIKINIPIIWTNFNTAETIKYASNSFLAIKIAFINEISRLKKLGVDIKAVSKGMGLDNRIGSEFLNPGPGFGGSCFPKDIEALLHKTRSINENLKILEAANISNELHKEKIFQNFALLFNNNLEGKIITILGLAFKANTDDVRSSPAITIIQKLKESGAIIKAYDPKAMKKMAQIFPDIQYCNSTYDALTNADGMIILTEWQEFKNLDLEKIYKIMKNPIIYDTRYILDEEKLKFLGYKFPFSDL